MFGSTRFDQEDGGLAAVLAFLTSPMACAPSHDRPGFTLAWLSGARGSGGKGKALASRGVHTSFASHL